MTAARPTWLPIGASNRCEADTASDRCKALSALVTEWLHSMYRHVMCVSNFDYTSSAAEEERLLAVVGRNTGEDGTISWVGVAAEMPGRTDNQVMRHWKTQEKGSRCGGPTTAFHAECEGHAHWTTQEKQAAGAGT